MGLSKAKFGVGAVVLLVSGVICKILGAFFRLPLTNLLGFEGIGVFQMIMTLYSFSLVLTSGGVCTTMAKLVSSALARQKYEKISTYFFRAILIGVGSGLVVGILFAVLGRYVCDLQKIEQNKSYLLFLILLPAGAVISAIRGYFQGYGMMMPTAISQIVEQVTKFTFGLLFAFLFGKTGTAGGVFGAFFGIVLSEIVTTVLLFVWFGLKREKVSFRQTVFEDKREFDKTNFLLVISASVIPLTKAFDGLVVVPRLMAAGFSNELAVRLFGLESGVVSAILNLPLVFSVAITTAILPNVSYAVSSGASSRKTIERGLKLLLYSILPSVFGLVAISNQLLPLCYGGLDESSIGIVFNMMLFEGFFTVLFAVMQFLLVILQANGKLKFIVLVEIIAGIVKMLLTIFLTSISSINIYALILGNIVMAAILCVGFLVECKKISNFSLDFSDLFVMLFSTVCMFYLVFAFLKSPKFGAVVDILVSVLFGVFVYVVFCIPFEIKLLPKKRRVKKV